MTSNEQAIARRDRRIQASPLARAPHIDPRKIARRLKVRFARRSELVAAIGGKVFLPNVATPMPAETPLIYLRV